MNTVLSLLKEQPGLPNTLLRPLLQKYLPHYKGMDPAFMRNFRVRALKFIISFPSTELTIEDVNEVASRSICAAEEVIDLDQPILLQNFTTLLRKCMQESSSTWVALRYLDETKDLVPGFDYRVHRDPTGRPDAIVWMTPNMKLNLLQYGRILFLDAQKRQYNTSNWPYIGPAMKDCEGGVCLAAECLCIQECLEMYIWILEMLHDMEPRYELTQTSIMFADELITPSVLVKLGIQDTCTLRGDHYHLLNEVWPSAFGSYCPAMRCHLEAMFSSNTIEQYQIGYAGAREVIHEDPAMCSKLDIFYDQPERYGGYFLKGMEEHLGLKGDVAAEQNHSSVCAHLGDGATWQIAEQVSKLLCRQQEQGWQRNEKEALENARTHRYKSRFKLQQGIDDILAKKALSMKAYKRFITSTLKPSTLLQYRTDPGGSVVVWPAGRLESDNYEKVVIESNQRCKCEFRVQFNALCKHEYKVDGKINFDKFARRWLNRTAFESRVLPSLSVSSEATEPTSNDRPVNRGDGWEDFGLDRVRVDQVGVASVPGNEDVDENFDPSSITNDNDEEETEVSQFGRLSYQSVKANCEEMCRYVQNDQLQLAELNLLVDRVLSRLRNKQNIHASFVDSPADVTNHSSFLPRDAVGKVVTNPRHMRRKRLRHEFARSTVAKKAKAQVSMEVTTTTNFTTSDDHHLPPPKLDQRACSFCKKAHHFVGKCPTLLQHGVPPLASNDKKARTKLQAELLAVGGVVTYTRESADERPVHISLPLGIGAIFIFKRMYVKNHSHKEHHDNYCVECTLHKKNGEENDLYIRSLFLVSCVATFVVRSSTNLIVCLLQSTNQVPPRNQLPPTQQISHFRNQNQFMNPMIGDRFSQGSNNFIYTQLSQQLSQQMSQNDHQQGFGYDFGNPSQPF
jgi:hypothetical protein